MLRLLGANKKSKGITLLLMAVDIWRMASLASHVFDLKPESFSLPTFNSFLNFKTQVFDEDKDNMATTSFFTPKKNYAGKCVYR